MKSIPGAIHELNMKISDQEIFIETYRGYRNKYQDLLAKGSHDSQMLIKWRFNLNKALYNIQLANKELEDLKNKLALVKDIASGIIEVN